MPGRGFSRPVDPCGMASDNFVPAATPKVGFSPSDPAVGGQRQKWGRIAAFPLANLSDGCGFSKQTLPERAAMTR